VFLPGQSDHADTPHLPATAYAVLGLLAFGRELTGYELRKWSMNMRFFYWSPAQSQIYAELRRLLAHGFVTERLEERRGRPDKRFYRTTEAGMAEFHRWLQREPVEPLVIKHSVMLRLFFGHGADPDRLSDVLEDYARWLRQQNAELSALQPELSEPFTYPDLIAEWGELFYAAELAAVEKMRERLRDLRER